MSAERRAVSRIEPTRNQQGLEQPAQMHARGHPPYSSTDLASPFPIRPSVLVSIDHRQRM